MKKLIAHFRTLIPVSLELETAIYNSFHRKEVQKKEILLREYRHVRKMYFIDTGMFRTYYYHNDKEITSWFYYENQFLTSWHGFYKQEVSYEFIEAVEDCTVFWIDYFAYKKLIEEYPKFERFARILAEEQLTFLDIYSKGYAFMSAKEKYQLLLGYFPDIELRVKLGYIASFLGISQETLSRIRSSK